MKREKALKVLLKSGQSEKKNKIRLGFSWFRDDGFEWDRVGGILIGENKLIS